MGASNRWGKHCSFSFLNHDYTEEDEEEEKKHFKIIFFIFFSVIMVQKQKKELFCPPSIGCAPGASKSKKYVLKKFNPIN